MSSSSWNLPRLGQNILRPWASLSSKRRRWAVGPFVVNGVVKDSQIKNLTDRPGPYLYRQSAEPRSTSLTLIVKTDGNSRAAMAAVRREILRDNKDLDLSRMRTMRQILAGSLVDQRFLLILLGGFAGCATLLAALGIYGVMSYLVTQRTREIGVRMALGARQRNVLALVLRHGALLTLGGIVLGLLGALAATRVLTSVLYSISSTDPLTFCGIALLLTAVALLACWLPARRAARVDPMEALRYE
ncbi:MAG: hypothetical protein DME22_17940 [Verrucomicrobia bacterium]|nr:MAG: hypothetical protein DME22_17940 [Verrucomicrobiota bacterium]